MNICLKISIVTPTLNRAEYLEETILSVIGQMYDNIEYIVIDGGSYDNSVEIIKKHDQSLSFWTSEPDEGMYHAIQKGFEHSTGDIMAWLNSDDKYQPGALEIVNQIFSSLPNVDWIIGIPTTYNKDGLCVKIQHQRKWAITRFWLGDFKWIQQESVFWRRSLWDKAGGYIDTKLKYAADFDLWCRFFKYAQLHSVGTVLGGFRLHGSQLSLKYAELYESEAFISSRKIQLKPSFVLNLLKYLWTLKRIIDKFDGKIFKYLSMKTSNLMDKIHKYPKSIYYNFSDNRWQV